MRRRRAAGALPGAAEKDASRPDRKWLDSLRIRGSFGSPAARELRSSRFLFHTGKRFVVQLVASFSRSSNLSVIRAGTGFVIGEGRSVRVQMFGLIE